MSRIILTLNQDEREALGALAQRERRDPRAQAALLLREILIARGFLPAESPTPITAMAQPAQAVPDGH